MKNLIKITTLLSILFANVLFAKEIKYISGGDIYEFLVDLAQKKYAHIEKASEVRLCNMNRKFTYITIPMYLKKRKGIEKFDATFLGEDTLTLDFYHNYFSLSAGRMLNMDVSLVLKKRKTPRGICYATTEYRTKNLQNRRKFEIKSKNINNSDEDLVFIIGSGGEWDNNFIIKPYDTYPPTIIPAKTKLIDGIKIYDDHHLRIENDNDVEIYTDEKNGHRANGILGNLKKEIPLYNGLIEGRAVYYYETGEVYMISTYNYGKKEGKEIEYDGYDNLIRETVYKNNKKEGIEKHFYPSKKIKYEIAYKNDKKNGFEKEYDEKGNITSEKEFKDGKRIFKHKSGQKTYSYNDVTEKEGMFFEKTTNKPITGIIFLEDVSQMMQIPVLNGKMNGILKLLNKKTNFLKSEISYKNGKKDGWYKKYYESGYKSFNFFKNDKREGWQESYYGNGQLSYKTFYKNGLVQGTVVSYHESGNIKSKVSYLDGKITDKEVIEYFDSGEVRRRTPYSHGLKNGVEKYFTKKGKIGVETSYKNDKKDGLERRFYDKSGKINRETSYKKGKKDGLSKRYFTNGNIYRIVNYQEGKQNGKFEEFRENGQLKIQANFLNNKREGKFIQYYENKNIHIIENYKNNSHNGKKTIYFKNGDIKHTGEFNNGKKIKESCFNKYKKPIKCEWNNSYKYSQPQIRAWDN